MTNTVLICVSHSVCVALFWNSPSRFAIQIKGHFISAFSWHSARFSLQTFCLGPTLHKIGHPSAIKCSGIMSEANEKTWVFENGFILSGTYPRANSLLNFPFVFGPFYKCYLLLSDQDQRLWRNLYNFCKNEKYIQNFHQKTWKWEAAWVVGSRRWGWYVNKKLWEEPIASFPLMR